MDWTPTVVVLTAVAVVALQSWQLFAQKKRASYVCGVLDLLVAISTLLGFFLFAAGALIISPEFSVLLAQGRTAWIWAKASLVALSVGIGLVLYAARCEEQGVDTTKTKHQPERCPEDSVNSPTPLIDWKVWRLLPSAWKRCFRDTTLRQAWMPEIFWIVLVGAIVGVGARLEVLNFSEPSVFFKIRCYDLWSPVLLAWILYCLSESIMTAIRDVPLRIRVLSVVMLISGLGMLAVDRAEARHFRYASFDSLIVWPFIVWIGVPAVLAIGSWILVSRWVPRRVRYREAGLVAASVLAAIAGLLSVRNWRSFDALWIIRPWFLTAACLALLLSLEVPRLYQLLRTAGLSDYFKSRRWRKAVALVAAGMVAASLADISHFSLFDPMWDIAAIIVGWVALIEIINAFPLWTLLRHTAHRVLTWRRDVRKTDADQQSKTQLPEKPEENPLTLMSKLKSSFVIVIDVLIVLVLFVAALEFFNIGKTIVQPFTVVDLTQQDKDQNKDLGKVVSDRIVNTLGLVKQQLRPDLLVVSGTDQMRWISAAGEEPGGLQAAVKSADVELPGTKSTINLGVFVAPIQGFMRQLIGVRVISGAVQWDGSKYVVLAQSSKGEIWRAEPRLSEGPSASPLKNELTVPQLGQQSTKEKLQVRSASSEINVSQVASRQKTDVESKKTGEAEPVAAADAAKAERAGQLLSLADQIAYRIVSTDPKLNQMGMTVSWEAIQPYLNGLVALKESALRQDYDELSRGIEELREAILKDPNFSLAHYRLGIALTEDGQPGAAVAHFELSLKNNPKSAATYIALANTLYYFENYYYSLPAALTIRMPYSERQEARNQVRANELWQGVIKDLSSESLLPDQAAAYAGLCLGVGLKPDLSASALAPQYIQFFYCKRAAYLYSKLPSTRRANKEIQDAVSWLYNQLGVILERSDLRGQISSSSPKNAANWNCNGQAAQRRLPSAYIESALKYYGMALKLQPEDRAICCNAATASWVLNDTKRMQDLQNDAEAHIRLGDKLRESARQQDEIKDAAPQYREALEEYQAAVELEPANISALNRYAYTFWSWRLRWPDEKPPTGPGPSIAHKAEKYARDAVRLTLIEGPRTRHFMVQSTLGEVLLADGRTHEAIEVLNSLVTAVPNADGAERPTLSSHAAFDEVRWELAQAYLCAQANGVSPKQETISAAIRLLDDIREHERGREDQQFAREPYMLDPYFVPKVCRASPQFAVEQDPDEAGPIYTLVGGAQQYDSLMRTSRSTCDFLGVIANAEDGKGQALIGRDEGLYLHFWGNGIDRRVPVGLPQKEEDIFITSKPTDTEDYYHAQLELWPRESDHIPMSKVYPIRTYKNESETRCPANWIKLKFRLARSPCLGSRLILNSDYRAVFNAISKVVRKHGDEVVSTNEDTGFVTSISKRVPAIQLREFTNVKSDSLEGQTGYYLLTFRLRPVDKKRTIVEANSLILISSSLPDTTRPVVCNGVQEKRSLEEVAQALAQ